VDCAAAGPAELNGRQGGLTIDATLKLGAAVVVGIFIFKIMHIMRRSLNKENDVMSIDTSSLLCWITERENVRRRRC
jgi:hypothetical protein